MAARADDAAQPQARIISGSNVAATDVASNGRWSAVVAIFATDASGTRLCTGTLIAANWVATAAHCIADSQNASVALPAQSVLVAAGVTSTQNATSALYPAISARVHPSFSWSNAQWDVALIELESTVPTTPFALPDALRPNTYVAGTADNVAGFGRAQATNSATSGTLRSGRLDQVDSGSCDTYNPGSGAYADCYLPSTTRQATCFGDSGGPLVRFDATQGNAPVLWGITSTGPDPCDAALTSQFAPSYATRVLAVADWLRTTMSGSTYTPKITSSKTSGTTTSATTSTGSTANSAGNTAAIGTFRTKLARKPSRTRNSTVTVSSSLSGALGTGKAEVRRCINGRCTTTSRKTVSYSQLSKTVTAKLSVGRCARHTTYSLRLKVYDGSGTLTDQASRRLTHCR
ncbi:MAG: trypsin-like serine protease [Patulibacter sp.]